MVGNGEGDMELKLKLAKSKFKPVKQKQIEQHHIRSGDLSTVNNSWKEARDAYKTCPI